MRLPDPDRSRIVIIGTSRYTSDKLSDLPVVSRTIADLAAVLTDATYGVVPKTHCTVSLDEGDIRWLGAQLRSAAAAAEDLFLVYYTGHGLIGARRHDLYLALTGSEWEAPEFNSLEYDKLRATVMDSPAATKIIILDCCFSGRTITDAMADPAAEVFSQIEVEGTYVLASAPPNEVSLYVPNEDYTAFTGRLLQLLRDGVAGGPDLLTVDELYRRLLIMMKAQNLPQPQKRGTQTASLLALTKNRAPVANFLQDSIIGEPTIAAGDSLVPIAGLLDLLGSREFVRTRSYSVGPSDVLVLHSQVGKYGLRTGDVIEGAVHRRDSNESKDEPFVLARLDKVNGLNPKTAKKRSEFNELTPVYPQEWLRLETPDGDPVTRIIDLVSPIGKGQRGLIISPPRAGKTTLIKAIAKSLRENHPECHLMVVVLDQRPEEVTDLRRSVKGEVIHPNFDDLGEYYRLVPELAVERAKRLVEQLRNDVVLILDSITLLSRAYMFTKSLTTIGVSDNVDRVQLWPAKAIFSAARSIEHGGSLTMLATLSTDTGSNVDQVICEEFRGAGNMTLRLSGELADDQLFPAVDVNSSHTWNDEVLLPPDQLEDVLLLRRKMRELTPRAALRMLLEGIGETESNVEFLQRVRQDSFGS